MTFPMIPPIEIEPAAPADVTATITYETYESFRWAEQDEPGYAIGAFDTDALAGTFEPVMNFGATGYRIDVE